MRTARELAAGRAIGQTRLLQVRQEYGFSLRDVAQAVGISAATASRLERGVVETKVQTALKLARFYETTVEQLFGSDD